MDHEGSCDHVEDEKRAGQVAELRFGETEFRLYQRLHSIQNGPVDIVHQVQKGEKNKSCARIQLLIRSQGRNLPRSSGNRQLTSSGHSQQSTAD